MNSYSVAVQLYIGCLWTNATETGLEPKHEIEPRIQTGLSRSPEFYCYTCKNKMERCKLIYYFLIFIKNPLLLPTLSYSQPYVWATPPPLSCRNCKLKPVFLATETEFVVYFRITLCSVKKFSYSPPLTSPYLFIHQLSF